jgi:transcriptional regulator with XRE-family HTH domain
MEMEFGKRLKTFVVAAYDEIRDFAADCGVSPSTVSMWFASKKVPGAESVEKIYNAGCSIDWLISGNGEMLAMNESGKKIREKLNMPDSEQEEIHSITYEKMVQVPFVKDLRVLLREDIKELLQQALAGQKTK